MNNIKQASSVGNETKASELLGYLKGELQLVIGLDKEYALSAASRDSREAMANSLISYAHAQTAQTILDGISHLEGNGSTSENVIKSLDSGLSTLLIERWDSQHMNASSVMFRAMHDYEFEVISIVLNVVKNGTTTNGYISGVLRPIALPLPAVGSRLGNPFVRNAQ